MPERSRRFILLAPMCLLVSALLVSGSYAQTISDAEQHLAEATELIGAFTDGGPDSIPTELLDRAHGIAVIPQVFRGGFILGARRGRGVLSVRMPDGSWSNPAFVRLTGGSVGWQIGAESTDVVLVFANENAVKNIATGKFTLGGEASAVAGPLRRQAATSMTFRAEVYGYLRSRGLYAGAAFQGARLDVDEELGEAYYGANNSSQALTMSGTATPPAARQFIRILESGAEASAFSAPATAPAATEDAALTFPLPD